MKKIFILDTNIFLTDPNALYNFSNNDIIIPFKVLEELDKKKNLQDVLGSNARHLIRKLDQLREKGNLSKGVKIEKGKGFVSVKEAKNNTLNNTPDNSIISVAIQAKNDNISKKVIVVSRDINMRVKCDSLNILAEGYDINKIIDKKEHIYTGQTNHLVDDQIIDRFYNDESIYLEKEEVKLYPNQFLMLISNQNDKKTALAKFINYSSPLKKINEYKKGIYGVVPKNKEQQFALNLLMDSKIPVVTLNGLAGSGKTLISIAAGLEQTIEKNIYKRLVVIRPVMPLGRDIGFLPGPQPLDSVILSENGWKRFGNLKIGDIVFARDGNKTKVINIFPKGIKKVYKIKTLEGSTECCEDHIWLTQTIKENRSKIWSLKSTNDIYKTLYYKDELNHFLPRNNPIMYDKKQLIIPPYTFGALLGDGCFTDTKIRFYNLDTEITERVNKELNSINCHLSQNKKHLISFNIIQNDIKYKSIVPFSITNLDTLEEKIYDKIEDNLLKELNLKRIGLYKRCKNEKIVDNKKFKLLTKSHKYENLVKEEIYKLGLKECTSESKFIPEIYKYSSIEDRLSLLQGLMDTDGSIKKKSSWCCFYTSSEQLALDVAEITKSLGGRAKIYARDRRNKKFFINNIETNCNYISYQVTVSLPKEFNPFYLSRKAKYYNLQKMNFNKIISIEYVGEKETQCILIDNSEHLYITNDFIVTHNSIQEKLEPYIMPIVDNLRFLFNNDRMMLDEYIKKDIIEIEAMTYIRGRSISDSFLLLDEAQNLTSHELKTVLTRIGENSKIVITGDLGQIDSPYLNETTSGLTNVIEKFKTQELSGHITLTKGERSLVATISSKIL